MVSETDSKQSVQSPDRLDRTYIHAFATLYVPRYAEPDNGP